MPLDIDRVHGLNWHETAHLYREIFLERIYLRGGLTIPPDALVVDVGANIGMYSLFVHSEVPSASILAFEPLPPLCRALRHNLTAHQVQARVFPYGLSDSDREVPFTYYPGYTTMSTQSAYADTDEDKEFVRRAAIESLPESDDGREVLEELDSILDFRFQSVTHTCRVRRLSEVIDEEGVDRIDMIKIDVQRAEMDVLRGIDRRHWPMVRQIVMEVHDAPGTDTAGRLDDVVRTLTDRGFQVTAEQDASLVGTDRHAVYAIRSTR
ncbi:FkbM family methyltransferase [Nocardia sp. NPDC046473]|uniref:FkbM family methyltransferase n=1 Tax=Nocardia sp. NPDC046473 TaxID=3155733 RepID=UPI0033C79CE3